MTVLRSPTPRIKELTNAGAPAAGYKIYTYAAGTTTPLATYQDRAGAVANTNPIILDARGEAVVYLLAGRVYDFVLKTDTDALVRTDEDVTADAGDSATVMFTQSGSGAVERSSRDKMRDTVSVKDFGAAMDGATNDTAALATALAQGKELQIPSGDMLVTSISNPLGLEFKGDGRIVKAITGGNQQLNSRCDAGQHVFGQEYLSAFHANLLNQQILATILLSGDSTTAGDATTAPFRPHEILKILGIERGHEIEVTNAGHSGKDTSEWVSTYLAADLATTPKLYVVRWGINDPYNGRTISQYATSLRQGLAQIRASYGVSQMSVLLMAPSSTSDTPNGRDEEWYEQARLVCRQAARDYQCAFVDTYALWKDARGAANIWMDDPFADGRAIHPKNVMNMWIYSKVAELLFPIGLHPRLFGATYGTLSYATAPTNYSYGQTIYSSASGSTDFLVKNASVLTQRSADGAIYQRAWSNYQNGANNGNYPAPQIMERMGLAGTWYTPITEPSIDLTSLLVNGWVPFDASLNIPRAKKTNNLVTLSGLIKSGTTAATTTLFTLPAGYRPRNSVEVFLQPMGPTGSATPVVIHVASNGVVTLQSVGNTAFVSLSGISFEVGA